MSRNGIVLLRISMGIVFLWFGALKFFPGLSPAQTLAGNTISILSFGLFTPESAVFILAVWECLIGVGLIAGCRRGFGGGVEIRQALDFRVGDEDWGTSTWGWSIGAAQARR